MSTHDAPPTFDLRPALDRVKSSFEKVARSLAQMQNHIHGVYTPEMVDWRSEQKYKRAVENERLKAERFMRRLIAANKEAGW